MRETRHRNTIWNIKVQTSEEAQAPLAKQLASLESHREDLLNKLRRAYERGPKSKPFDAEGSWSDLTRIADRYLWADRMKQDRMPAGTRVKRLGELASILG